jgi:methionyl-tRNA formyltransferase
MRIYLSGKGVFAHQVGTELLTAGHQLVGISSPRLRSRFIDESNVLAWDRLRTWAMDRNIAWTDADLLRAQHIPNDTDIILAAHSHSFIGSPTRARARVAAIGYHPSLLPLHRGRDAIRWTIRDRDRVTGGTVYHLSDRTDGGPIAAQEHVIVPSRATADSLWREQLAPLGVHLLLKVVADLAVGRRIEVPQDESLATWEPAMSSPPLFKPELIALPGAQVVDGHHWALHGS